LKQHVILDLDETIVDTSKIYNYRKSPKGQDFATQNIAALTTKLYDPSFLSIVKSLHARSMVSFVSNAPVAYIIAVLAKHGFPSGIPVFGSASKPSPQSLQLVLRQAGVTPDNTLSVGDSSKDVLAAHAIGIPTVAVSWGYNSRQQLECAEPVEIIDKPAALEDRIVAFEKGKITYKPRERPKGYINLPRSEFNTPSPAVQLLKVSDYYKYVPGQRDPYSARILTFKESKEHTQQSIITDGATDDYFYDGRILRGTTFRSVLTEFMGKVRSLLAENNLEGETLVIAAPNSMPEYCYRTDMNALLAFNVARNQEHLHYIRERVISRVHPKEAAHSGGSRFGDEQYTTLGFKEIELPKYDNVVILDDITTSGSQGNAIAKLVRHGGMQGKLYLAVLGKTA